MPDSPNDKHVQNKLGKCPLESLDLSDCLDYFAARQGDAQRQYVEAARAHFAGDSDFSIDDNAIAAGDGANGGEWVLGWIWIESEIKDVHFSQN